MASTMVGGCTGSGIQAALQQALRQRFEAVRQRSLRLAEPLTPEDMMVQSCAEASPAKWHLAHTAWFFESFVAVPYLHGYQKFNKDFTWLFNSYYETFAEFPDKKLRASFSRPGVEEVLQYRAHVDEAVDRLLESEAPEEALRRIELGLHHEEQHQELMLTDIKHAFYVNPLQPAYLEREGGVPSQAAVPMRFMEYAGGLVEIGAAGLGTAVGGLGEFSFDNERPRHRVWLEPFRLASRLVTVSEYLEFMNDGGYARPELWLSAGWQMVKDQKWSAPLYWNGGGSRKWTIGSLRGPQNMDSVLITPVTHVSYFEADAYARWAKKRLPTEAEWETVAASVSVDGNLLDSGQLETVAVAADKADGPQQLWGDCWEWTASAYLGYPGFAPMDGSLGEYNGKFMSGQMILRGGSCVTPKDHIRATYRNFFSPETRWQFSGIRLADL